jgi:hypothetical protein
MRYGHLIMSIFCAWVLWQTDSLPNGTINAIIPIDAFESQQACGQVRLREEGAWELQFSGIPLKDRAHRVRLECLPDTIDPRAPMGK